MAFGECEGDDSCMPAWNSVRQPLSESTVLDAPRKAPYSSNLPICAPRCGDGPRKNGATRDPRLPSGSRGCLVVPGQQWRDGRAGAKESAEHMGIQHNSLQGAAALRYALAGLAGWPRGANLPTLPCRRREISAARHQPVAGLLTRAACRVSSASEHPLPTTSPK